MKSRRTAFRLVVCPVGWLDLTVTDKPSLLKCLKLGDGKENGGYQGPAGGLGTGPQCLVGRAAVGETKCKRPGGGWR